MLSPGIWDTVTGVTFDPKGFEVFPVRFRPEKEKSLGWMSLGFLHGKPFTSTGRERLEKSGAALPWTTTAYVYFKHV